MSRAQFIGAWRLVSQHSRYPDGRVVPSRGEGVDGVIMYDAAGMMSVQLLRTDTHAASFRDLSTLETALQGFLAYFGTYSVDERGQVISHYVLRSSYPGFVGRTLTRVYTFEQDRLTLTAPSPADDSIRELIWQRIHG